MRRCGICVLIIGSIALTTVSLTVQSAVTPQNPSQDLTNLEGLLGRLQAEIHRLQRPDLTEGSQPICLEFLQCTHSSF